jgi:type I restriction enzyme S subunit
MSGQHDNFLHELPNGWKFYRLKDVVALRNEKTSEATEEEDYLELEDLESGTGRILSRRNTVGVESAVTVFKKGDVLFGKLRPYLEKYYQADFDGKCTGEILAFKPERIASRFLFYCVGWQWFIERCNALAYGAKMPRVSWPTQLSQFNIPLPPLPEQERIVAYLDASCVAIDSAVAAKRRQVETLDRLSKTTVNVAVTQGCDQRVPLVQTGSDWFPLIPSAWRVVRFKSLFRVIYRYPTYFNIEYVPEGIPEVRGEALTPDGFIERLTDERYISAETSSLFPMTRLEIGDIVMSVRGTMGKIGIVDERYAGANITANLLRLSPDRNLVTGEFLRWLMRSIYFNEALNSSAPQTTIKTITMPQLAKLRIALPPRPEQQAICDFLEAKITEIKSTTALIERQIETLLAYRRSLIHECVTGQRRVTEVDIKRVEAHG